MINLSPAARRGIFHNLIACDGLRNKTDRDRDGRRIKEVVMYRCPECRELHDDEDDAIDCCEVEGLHDEEAPSICPVCAAKFSSPHEASDCCLWKDIDALTRWRMADKVEADALTRWRMADKVEAGATWAEVLGVKA